MRATHFKLSKPSVVKKSAPPKYDVDDTHQQLGLFLIPTIGRQLFSIVACYSLIDVTFLVL
jgi:hypothetical protein